jgi:hypothetical protein
MTAYQFRFYLNKLGNSVQVGGSWKLDDDDDDDYDDDYYTLSLVWPNET